MQAKCIEPFKMIIRLQICLKLEFFKNLRDHRVFNYQLNKLKISKTKAKFRVLAVVLTKMYKICKLLTILILNNF